MAPWAGSAPSSDGDLVELHEASWLGGAEGGNGRDEVVHGLGLQVLGERSSAGVDLVEVEAAGYVAGLVGGEGEAAGLAADLGGQFGDLLAEPAGQARPGVQRTAIVGRGPGLSRLIWRLR
jgi:hypothetical protein